MQKILIEGGSSLKGKVKISGAKNAALPVIAACLLTGGWHKIHNVPDLRDIQTIKKIMEGMGVVFKEEGNSLYINSENLNKYEAPFITHHLSPIIHHLYFSKYYFFMLFYRAGRTDFGLCGNRGAVASALTAP